jgi:hypothetical protein
VWLFEEKCDTELLAFEQMQEELLTEDEGEEDSEPEEDIALEKQLAWASHRIKELENLIENAVRVLLIVHA